MNFVLGLATAIILGALINLGIRAFYPEPIAPTYPNYPIVTPIAPCASNDAACIKNNTAIGTQERAYQDQMNTYNRNLFIIANIIGVIMFMVGFLLVFSVALASYAVPVGVMLAGLWSIMYGYARGWGSIDDRLKFSVGLVIAVLVIGGGTWLMQRYQKKQSAKA